LAIELKRKLTDEEVEQICTAAEEAARGYLLSKVPLKQISELEVTIDAVGDKPLMLEVGVAVELSSGSRRLDPLVEDATKAAFEAAENKARELQLCVDTRN